MPFSPLTIRLSQLVGDVSLPAPARGDLLTQNASSKWVSLTPGTSGHFLKSAGAGADLTWAALVAGDIPALAHSSLTGLTSGDDHTQYALLAGRATGQTLVGGTASGEDLTLQSTAHATKGSILFGTSAYDEVNNRLGLGTTSPSNTLHVVGDIRLVATSTGGSNGIFRYYHTTNLKWNQYTYDVGGINRFSWSNASGVDRLNVLQTGEFAVGTGVNLYTGSYDLTVRSSNAATNSIVNTFAVAGITTGTVGVGYGVGQLFLLESSTTNDTTAGKITCRWGNVTHANREGIIAIIATDYGGDRTGFEVTGNGSATEIGFYGVTPVARPSAYTQTYSTATKTHAALTSATLTDNSGGTANTTVQALTDPADTPASADALRDDLVANLIPELRNNFADLVAQINALRVDLENAKQVLNASIDDDQSQGLKQ